MPNKITKVKFENQQHPNTPFDLVKMEEFPLEIIAIN